MERITFEGNFCDISMCRENPCPYNGMCSQRQTWERLKKYEDAEQAGRLVVLPWAVGDVIYEADKAHGVVKHTFAEKPAWMMHSYAIDDAGNEWYDGWGSSDETPFYKTREEAEEALAGKDSAAPDAPEEPAEPEWKSRVMRTFLGGRET